jgi:hypothetical protein
MSLSGILTYLEAVSGVVAMVPSPAQPFAALALQLEKITHAAIKAQAASKGQTVEEVIAGLHHLEPIP